MTDYKVLSGSAAGGLYAIDLGVRADPVSDTAVARSHKRAHLLSGGPGSRFFS